MTLRFPALIRIAALPLDHRPQLRLSLASRSRGHLAGRGEQGRQPVAILDQVLPPTDGIDVLKQNLDLAAD